MENQRKVFTAVKELCTGCRICELVCSLGKMGNLSPAYSRIKIVEVTPRGPNLPIYCRHCTDPPCLEACPVPEAMFLDEGTGAAVIKDQSCIGCLACVEACPFGAIQVSSKGEVLKCDLCAGDPLCVKYCPTRPANSLPHLPWPEQSCLQYVEPRKLNANKIASQVVKE